jgi:hypothetical protein
MMAISSVNTATQQGITNSAGLTTATNAMTEAGSQVAATGEAAVFEKTAQTTANTKTYTRDAVTFSEITQQVESKLSSLRAAVENLVAMQQVKTGVGQGLNYDQILQKYDGKLKDFYQNLEVDDATRAQAQQDIAVDGFWGVEQTSERTVEFAKAISGGDPAKIELLRQSIIDGYAAAEKSWGGALPEISKQTQEATLKGLDDWAKEAAQTA